MHSTNYNFEILIVLDGSTDFSIDKISELTKKYAELKYVYCPTNAGKGAAVTVGFSKAIGDYIGFLDLDMSLCLDDWIEMINIINVTNKYDSVIASRYLTYENINQPIVRKFFGHLFNYIVRHLFKIKLYDTQCGGKIFTRKAVELILTRTTLKGFAFDVEYLKILKENNLNILEMPAKWGSSNKSNFLLDILSVVFMGVPMLFELFRLKSNSSTVYTWKDITNTEGSESDA